MIVAEGRRTQRATRLSTQARRAVAFVMAVTLIGAVGALGVVPGAVRQLAVDDVDLSETGVQLDYRWAREAPALFRWMGEEELEWSECSRESFLHHLGPGAISFSTKGPWTTHAVIKLSKVEISAPYDVEQLEELLVFMFGKL